MWCRGTSSLGLWKSSPKTITNFQCPVVRTNNVSSHSLFNKIIVPLPLLSLSNRIVAFLPEARYFATKKPEKKTGTKGKAKGDTKKTKPKEVAKSKSPAKKKEEPKKKVAKETKEKEKKKTAKPAKEQKKEKPKEKAKEKAKEKEQRAKERERKKKELEKAKEERKKEKERKAKEKSRISKEQAKEEKRRLKEEKELKPKRVASPYALFLKEQYPVIAKQNPDLAMSDMAKKIAEKWADLSDRQKETYVQKSAQDRERWQREMEAYEATLPPKKPPTSFLLFVQANREAVQNQYPSKSLPEITTELGKRWQKLSDSEKQTYVNKAAKAREKYEEELAKWRAKHESADDLD